MVSLDREEDLSAARRDPNQFLDDLGTPTVVICGTPTGHEVDAVVEAADDG